MRIHPHSPGGLVERTLFAVMVMCLLTVAAFAQNQGAQVSGVVTDQTGSAIPHAAVAVLNKDNSILRNFETNEVGFYIVPLLQPGNYKLTVTAKGFETLVRDGVVLAGTQNARVDFSLHAGAAKTESVVVEGDSAQINTENAQLETGIPPSTLASLPLIVSGGPRNMSGLVTLVPGVTSATSTATSAHMNGGLAFEQETILDGVGIAYATGGSGMFNLTLDFPQSPDMIREVNVLTSNYSPEYGNSAAATIILETKSGTSQFHGAAFEYHRNTLLNAAQYGTAGKRSKDLENEFGAAFGGPVMIPKLQTAKSKPFFFFIWEGFRMIGANTKPTVTIPSLKEREGDFSDWLDSQGNLIPVYDPATTQIVEGVVQRQQFMGCDGNSPNVICATDPRLQNSLAKSWLQFLPTPTSSEARNNYTTPRAPTSLYNNRNTLDSRVDEYYGEKDHISASYYEMRYANTPSTTLPPQLSTEVDCSHSCWNLMFRFNEDHTFSPKLLNHFAYGLTRAGNNVQHFPNQKYSSLLPKVPGLPANDFTTQITFGDGFNSFDGSNGSTGWSYVTSFNDMLVWSHGRHTFKLGGEYRRIAENKSGGGLPEGQFGFAPGETGLLGQTSGNSIASFLLEQVDKATATFWGLGGIYNTRQYIGVLHAGDTWKASPKLSLNYGVRWDVHQPSEEKNNKMSFFDPDGLNPTAGNLPGRLAFAGKQWGEASYGARYPETVVLSDFAPRLGFAYSVSDKTVVRGGYGIFYSDAKYPGWSMGFASDGFDANPVFSSSLGGLQAATILSDGLPQTFNRPPFIDSSYLNGQSAPLYRSVDGNHVPYSQQWDIIVERQVTNNLHASVGYTGNKGTHLYSTIAATNVLNPGLLSMGSKLNDQFSTTDTTLDGVAAPYASWASQSSCGTSVAQALLPHPQYCGTIPAVNENKGISEFHSLQLKVEKRASENSYLLASYTFSKMLANVDSTQPTNENSSLFSPYQRKRAWGLAAGDVTHTFTVAYVYHLPFGSGKRWLSQGAIADKFIGGWQTSGVLHVNSAPPFSFTSSTCNVPSQFGAKCIPAVLPGVKAFAQDPKHFNPSLPLFNTAAFEPVSAFNYYLGNGSRATNLRAFPYHNEDMALFKDTAITEHVNFQLRFEAFNIWNWHIFQSGSNYSTQSGVISTDLGNNFGMWNKGISAPRNIQVAGRITF